MGVALQACAPPPELPARMTGMGAGGAPPGGAAASRHFDPFAAESSADGSIRPDRGEASFGSFGTLTRAPRSVGTFKSNTYENVDLARGRR